MHGSVGFNHLTRMGFENRATVTNSLGERMNADLFNSSIVQFNKALMQNVFALPLAGCNRHRDAVPDLSRPGFAPWDEPDASFRRAI